MQTHNNRRFFAVLFMSLAVVGWSTAVTGGGSGEGRSPLSFSLLSAAHAQDAPSITPSPQAEPPLNPQAQPPDPQAEPPLAPEPGQEPVQAAASPAAAGITFVPNSIAALNQGELFQGRYVMEETIRERGVEFIDKCSDTQEAVGTRGITDHSSDRLPPQPITPVLTGRADVEAFFASTATPPAPGLRVVLRNASQATQVEKMPFTDRDYSQGLTSERFVLAADRGHKKRALSVSVGQNNLLYEIKQGNETVEAGQFDLTLGLNYRNFTRVVTIPRPKLEMACVDKKK